MEKTDLLDLVIIGAAAAGSAAAVYAARRNLNFVVVAKDIGGEVALSGEVENWTGTIKTTGFELSQKFHEHVKSYGVQIDEGFGVEDIRQEENVHIVLAKNLAGEERTYRTKAVIIASGIHPRQLGVPGEKELKGRGVTYCTVCDGPLYRGKITATIGAGNAAVESALMMADLAEKVYLITKYDKETKHGFPKAENVLVDKLLTKENVEIIYEANTTEVLGEQMVSGVRYETPDGESHDIETNGVMVHIGMIPNSDFVKCTEKNPQKEIIVQVNCETSCPGVYAAGDVSDVPFKQIVIAAGQGATAALSAIDYINRWQPEA